MTTDIPTETAQDPWFKIVAMLQQNWAVILEGAESGLIVFYDDRCGVFDEIQVSSVSEASEALLRNGFSKFRESPESQKFIALPTGKFRERAHPDGRIYSSGRFWR